MYELFDHTADLGLRVQAATWPDLLAEAGRGLFAMLVANPQAIRAVEQETIDVAGDQPDLLLHDWLSELLYRFQVRHMLAAEFDIRETSTGLHAEVAGEPFDPQRHELDHDIKAITYHGLVVEQFSGGWRAEVVVDI